MRSGQRGGCVSSSWFLFYRYHYRPVRHSRIFNTHTHTHTTPRYMFKAIEMRSISTESMRNISMSHVTRISTSHVTHKSTSHVTKTHSTVGATATPLECVTYAHNYPTSSPPPYTHFGSSPGASKHTGSIVEPRRQDGESRKHLAI